jgi:hypothetical protein
LRASAYLNIFDDWDLLGAAVASFYDRVDEIVVVDGAYRWMAPLFEADGRDPTRSRPEVHVALAPFADKVRVISGLWDNELHKRMAGYQACSERYVFRVDADEVMFFDDAEIERFLASEHGVAEMEMPIMLAPDLLRSRPGLGIERQALLFDRERVGALEHCSHLWLVLPEAERARLPPQNPSMVWPAPIAFNAHLTHWRRPLTAVSRARFYDLNYLREKRHVPWLGLTAEPGVSDAEWVVEMLRHVEPRRLTQRLLGHATTLGYTWLDGFGVGEAPLGPEQKALFATHRTAQLDALAELNLALSAARRVMQSQTEYMIDLSTPAARAALGAEERASFAFEGRLAFCTARLDWLTAASPYSWTVELPVEVRGERAWVTLPQTPVAGSFRCVMRLWAQTDPAKPLILFGTV